MTRVVKDSLEKRGRDNYFIYGVLTADNGDGTYDVKLGNDILTLEPRIGKVFSIIR